MMILVRFLLIAFDSEVRSRSASRSVCCRSPLRRAPGLCGLGFRVVVTKLVVF